MLQKLGEIELLHHSRFADAMAALQYFSALYSSGNLMSAADASAASNPSNDF